MSGMLLKPAAPAVLSGTWRYTLDRKGRLVLPLPLREGLGPSVVITRAPDQCLQVLSPRTWAAWLAREGEDALFQGYYLAAAMTLQTDRLTGRILIPAELRQHSGLHPARDAVVMGVGTRVVICSGERWDARLRELHGEALRRYGSPLERLRLARGRAESARATP